MKKKSPISKNPSRLLIFDQKKILIMFCHSISAASNALKVAAPNICNACSGKAISCAGLYFRYLNDNIEIEPSDYGTLNLEDYDKMCGVERKYYRNNKMNRVGMKYNMKPSQKANKENNKSKYVN